MRAMISIFATLVGPKSRVVHYPAAFVSDRSLVCYSSLRPFVVRLCPGVTDSETDAAQIVLKQDSGGRAAAWQTKKQEFRTKKISTRLRLRLGRRTIL